MMEFVSYYTERCNHGVLNIFLLNKYVLKPKPVIIPDLGMKVSFFITEYRNIFPRFG